MAANDDSAPSTDAPAAAVPAAVSDGSVVPLAAFAAPAGDLDGSVAAVGRGPGGDGEARQKALAASKEYLGMGVGIGAVGLASAALFGAACPLCVVAAPAFIGLGVVKRWQARRR